jgi:hypothetical protein
VLALCGAAIGFFALGAAAAYDPRAGVSLAGGILPVVRNVLGMTGIGLTFCLVTGALIAWIGPVADRPGRLDRRHGRPRRRPDRVHHQGPRVRPSGELRQAH